MTTEIFVFKIVISRFYEKNLAFKICPITILKFFKEIY